MLSPENGSNQEGRVDDGSPALYPSVNPLVRGKPGCAVSLLPAQESYNLDVLLELLISVSDQARVTQLNRHRRDADAGTPRVLNALQQTAGLVKVGVKLSRK